MTVESFLLELSNQTLDHLTNKRTWGDSDRTVTFHLVEVMFLYGSLSFQENLSVTNHQCFSLNQ